MLKYCSCLYISYSYPQILEETETQCFIHYTGWPATWDTWIDKDKVVTKVISEESVLDECQVQNAADELKKRILFSVKKKLSYHRASDPECCFTLECSEQVFSFLFGDLTANLPKEHGGTFNISVQQLLPVLGKNWHIRVLNRKKELCHVIDRTFRIRLAEHRPVKEFQIKEDGSVCERWFFGGHFLSVKFLRGEGTGDKLDRFSD